MTDLFGNPTGELVQADAFPRGPQGLTEALSEARATLSLLASKAEAGALNAAQARRYHEARALVRHSEGLGLDETEILAPHRRRTP